jgi:hypothetical protein
MLIATASILSKSHHISAATSAFLNSAMRTFFLHLLCQTVSGGEIAKGREYKD